MDQSRRWLKGGLILAAVFGLAAAVFWMFTPADNEKPIRSVITELEKRSVPPGGRLLNNTEPALDNRGVKAVWELELSQAWNEYAQWIKDHFSDFKITAPEEGKILMFKQLPGDTLRLSIEKVNDRPLRVRISLHGYPS